MPINRSLAAALFLTLSIPTVASAADKTGPVTDDAIQSYFAKHPEALDTVIHDYLTKRHPEALNEANQVLRQRADAAKAEMAKTTIASNNVAIFHDVRDPVVGNPNGDVSLVIFQDKSCPYCKLLQPAVAKLVEADKGVRVVYKEYPILGDGSSVAARAVLASMNQGKFEEFNKRLLTDKTPEHQLGEPHIMEIAQEVGLDVTRLKKDMDAPDIGTLIADNRLLAGKLGITGTPALLINDQLIPGYLNYEDLTKRVAEVRGQKRAATN